MKFLSSSSMAIVVSVMTLTSFTTPGLTTPTVTQPIDFAKKGPPKTNGNGGSRGECPATAQPLTALVPIEANNGGLTTSERPTIWVYVPYELSADRSVEFVLVDANKQDVYKTKITGTGQPAGIMGITLPKDVPALQVDQWYTWFFKVNCDRLADRPATVIGSIKRVQLDAEKQTVIDQASPLQKSNLYAQESIWYDALHSLAVALQANPTDLKLRASWSKLLKLPDVKLGAIAQEPLVPRSGE